MRKTDEGGKRMSIRNERGITLVALVLTVVIMIILAAVTINITLGDNGLVQQTKEAAGATINSTTYEQQQIVNLTAQVNEILTNISM